MKTQLIRVLAELVVEYLGAYLEKLRAKRNTTGSPSA